MMKYLVVILTIGMNMFPIMSTIVVDVELQENLEATIPTTTTTTTESPTTPAPTIDYCAFYNPVPGIQRRFLRLHTMKKSWDEARTTCELEGAFLAVPRSGQELELYMDHVSRLGLAEGRDINYWIGVRRNDYQGPLTTPQGDSVTYKELIHPTPPTYWTGPECWYLSHGEVSVRRCDYAPFSFLCEKNNCG